MDNRFIVYISPLELDSTQDRLIVLPMPPEELDALCHQMGQNTPLYVEVSDYGRQAYLAGHLPEDPSLVELNMLAEKLTVLSPRQALAFEHLVRTDLEKGLLTLELARLVELANCAISSVPEREGQM